MHNSRPAPILPSYSYFAAYQYIFEQVFWLLLVGLFSTQTVFAEPPKPATPLKLRTLVNRDPCEHPKRYYCTQPTTVKIGRYLLKIPHNLIGQRPPTNDFIELLLRWPGLRGSIKDEKYNEHFDSYDVVHVLIHTERPRCPKEEGIRDLIQRLNLSPPVPLENGLLEYRNPRANNAVWAYIPIDQTGLLPKEQPLYIHTGGPASHGDINTVRGQFGYTIKDDLYVTVRFARRHINDWKAITASTRNLVESFFKE